MSCEWLWFELRLLLSLRLHGHSSLTLESDLLILLYSLLGYINNIIKVLARSALGLALSIASVRLICLLNYDDGKNWLVRLALGSN